MLETIVKFCILYTLTFSFSACGRGVTATPKSVLRNTPEALAPYIAIRDEIILIKNTNIHVGNGQPPLTNSSILIMGENIVAVGPHSSITIPDNARIIDLKGGAVMPGIIGMHNHTHMPGITLMDYTAPRMYLASGVTTIQTTGSADALGELSLKKAIDVGDVPGPHIFPTSPYVTGPDGNDVMFKPKNEVDARAFVKKWSNKGVTWIKLYRHAAPVMAAIIIDEAHKQGLKVTGHLCSITYREAAKMGIDSIEHGLNASADFIENKPTRKCVPSKASKLALDPQGPEIGSLIKILINEDVTITSTLAIHESNFPHRPQGQARALKAMSPELRDRYKARQSRLQKNAERTTSTQSYWNILTQFERRFVNEGGRLVAGPDTGRHVLPGYGDQRNFELLIESGFTIPQTIKIMTYNGAQALGIDAKVGLIKKNYRADLIVFTDTLTKNSAVINTPKYVFKGGIGYSPEKLLADIEGQIGLR